MEDDGPGTSKQERTYFEAFARLDDSAYRASGGYGLGLSIVSRIAYWFGGDIMEIKAQTGGAFYHDLASKTL